MVFPLGERTGENGASIYDQPPFNWFMEEGLEAEGDLPGLDAIFKDEVDLPLARICFLRAVADNFPYGKVYRIDRSGRKLYPEELAQTFIRDEIPESAIFPSERYDQFGNWRVDNPWTINLETESYAYFAVRSAEEERRGIMWGIEELKLGLARAELDITETESDQPVFQSS